LIRGAIFQEGRFVSRILLLCAALVLSACVSIPRELAGGGPFTATIPLQAQQGDHDGERVRWGGTIIRTTPQVGQTCFEVMGLPLGNDAAPQAVDRSIGRFIACGKGFYEPAIFTAGREVTFTGHIDGTEKQKVGEYLYDFPRLTFDAVHLWPQRSETVYVPYYDPFWDPFWPYYYQPYYHRPNYHRR
jgi:outer membrane lipoprotein